MSFEHSVRKKPTKTTADDVSVLKGLKIAMNNSSTDHAAGKRTVYRPQSENLHASNKYLTDLSFPLDDYCVLTAQMPAGGIVPLHSHFYRESFYLLSGEMHFYGGASWRVLKQGDFIDVLSNAKHAWRNASKLSAALLVVTTVKMGVFLQQVSRSVETKLDTQGVSA